MESLKIVCDEGDLLIMEGVYDEGIDRVDYFRVKAPEEGFDINEFLWEMRVPARCTSYEINDTLGVPGYLPVRIYLEPAEARRRELQDFRPYVLLGNYVFKLKKPPKTQKNSIRLYIELGTREAVIKFTELKVENARRLRIPIQRRRLDQNPNYNYVYHNIHYLSKTDEYNMKKVISSLIPTEGWENTSTILFELTKKAFHSNLMKHADEITAEELPEGMLSNFVVPAIYND